MQISVPDTALLHFLTNDCLNFIRGDPGSSLHLNIADLKKTCRRCSAIARKNENPHNDCESELEKRRHIAEHCSDTCGQRLATTFASPRSLGRASRTTLTTHAAAVTNLVCNGLLSHVYSFRFNSPVVSSTSVFSFGSFARHSSISYSSSIPCSRFTRSRISSARTSASSARAPSPSVTIKFAWIGDTSALSRDHTRRRSSRARPRQCLGFHPDLLSPKAPAARHRYRVAATNTRPEQTRVHHQTGVHPSIL